MTAMAFDTGSFRDPGGRILHRGEKIYRTIAPVAQDAYRAVEQSGALRRLADEGQLVEFKDVTDSNADFGVSQDTLVLEHPRLPFISYPYEWSYSLHRQAALFHLELQLSLLADGLALSDATAYNVQFDGSKPVFIDHLSVRPYKDGEIWAGHRQFCMQFLNPLLMWSMVGVEPNHWFRGNLEGVAPEDLARMLPLRKKMSWNVLTHVIAQAAMQKRSLKASQVSADYREARLPKSAFEGILHGLHKTITNLKAPSHVTVWGGYANNTSYDDAEKDAKIAFVKKVVASVNPDLIYDIGCNSGDYSVASLEAGAKRVIGFDFDHGALEIAYDRANKQKLPFLPLWLDAANPSPAQGWGQQERKGMSERASPDAMIALAVIHHIVIGRNVPLDMATDWLLALAPTGVIEFPHKSDPMVQTLLSQREDIFPDYEDDVFAKILGDRARIVEKLDVRPTRTLYWYEKV